MNFWDNLTNAEINRTENELKVKVISTGKYFLLTYLILIVPFIMATFFSESTAAIIVLIVSFVLFLLMNFKLKEIERFNSNSFSITKDKMNGTTSISGHSLESITFTSPYFIDIFVSILKKGIRVSLENKGLVIGFYTLKNGKDLTKLIDGFTELLDLELYENKKLSNGEVLSFKSRNNSIEPYSGLWIRTPNNKLLISSLPNTSHWMELDSVQQILKNKTRTFALKDIEKIEIQTGHLEKMNVNIITKQGKSKMIFKHKTSEITMIRDENRLLETLQNEPNLKGIEIKILHSHKYKAKFKT